MALHRSHTAPVGQCESVGRPPALARARDAHAIARDRSTISIGWAKACTELGLAGRIVHDLRRSGVRHLIRGGVPRHTVMAFSGHRTVSMLKRYDIIDVDDLRRAAERASEYRGEPATVVALPTERATATETPTVARRS